MKTDNKLIAEFMGVNMAAIDGYYVTCRGRLHYNEMEYDTSWAWLMPVVERIENDLLFQVEIHTAYTNINGELDGAKYNQDSCFEAQSDTKLTVTYNAVVEFIKWHNSQNK